MWWTFTTPYTGGANQNIYTYDATASDFPAVVVLYDAATGAFEGCSANGKFGGTPAAGEALPRLHRPQAWEPRHRHGHQAHGQGPPGLPQCSDGRDNDGDTRIDHPADPDCVRLADNAERTMPQCSDGEDNDGDGLIDARPRVGDPGCENRGDNDEIDTVCADNRTTTATGTPTAMTAAAADRATPMRATIPPILPSART